MLLSLFLAACAATPLPEITATPIIMSTATPTVTPMPTSSPTPLPTPTPTLTPTPKPKPGTVTGDTCYPSSLYPPIMLYLENIDTEEIISQEMAQGQTDFSFTVPPGQYVVYAQTVGTEVWGGYTKTAACEDCEGHELLPFTVTAGTTTEINLCDWDHSPGFRPPDSDDDEAITITTIQNTNLYAAPTLADERLMVIPPRTTANAIARTADNHWYQVKTPAGDLWLYGLLTQIKGDIFTLPIWPDTTNAEPEPPRDQFKPTAWSAAENGSIVHFRGFIRNKHGNPMNGFSVLLDNGTWSVLSHPTGASRHYPETDDGEWDLVIKNAADAAGWWALTVVSYDCADFEIGFDAQCKEFTPLSQTQIVPIVYPDENVIFADWLCLEDCDKGLYYLAYRHPEEKVMPWDELWETFDWRAVLR